MHGNPDYRLDVHNTSIDTELANAHLCGTTDLRTGRTCAEPFRHRGPCNFVSKQDARLQVQRAHCN